MEQVAVLAITKNGISTGLRLLESFPDWHLYAPDKFRDAVQVKDRIRWYSESTSSRIAALFAQNEGLICLFSLGATIRLVAPHMKSKKTDPAVIVIDEAASFVISVLSGHIGGANSLAESIAAMLGAQPVITTAADVKKTIAVDMVGRSLGWVIEDDSAVTTVSALMVNEEKIGVYQDAGTRKWYDRLPANVTIHDTLEDLMNSDARAHLIISDRIVPDKKIQNSVVYRPPTLVVGIGLHQTTSSDTIINGISKTFERFGLYTGSIAQVASMKKTVDVIGLRESTDNLNVPLVLLDRNRLADVRVPNPSGVVEAFEGTASVSEAAAIVAGGGPTHCSLIVEKQKFPPDLTVAVARRLNKE